MIFTFYIVIFFVVLGDTRNDKVDVKTAEKKVCNCTCVLPLKVNLLWECGL